MILSTNKPTQSGKSLHQGLPLPHMGLDETKLGQLAGHHHSWLHNLRHQAFITAQKKGLPHPKDEKWRYTNFNKLSQAHFSDQSAHNLLPLFSLGHHPLLTELHTAHLLMMVNGQYRPDLSSKNDVPSGLFIQSLTDVLATSKEQVPTIQNLGIASKANGLSFLNLALLNQGLIINVAANTLIEPILHLVHYITDQDVACPIYHHITVQDHADLTIVETYIRETNNKFSSWSLPSLNIKLGKNSKLRHYKYHEEHELSFHTAETNVVLDSKANYENFYVTYGTVLNRHHLSIFMQGDHSQCQLNGLYILNDKNHTDIYTEINHQAYATTSKQSYKGILDDYSHGIFQGNIIMEKEAVKGNGQQLNKTLTLSPHAQSSSKPGLEIYVDDVQCSHGTTSGQIREDELFYLRSRGLDPDTAQRLVIGGFIEESLNDITHAKVKDAFSFAIHHPLEKGKMYDNGLTSRK
ncbi:MAG: Fe-S cluster assembly protein SufD [Alphaproteobacteria bacterium]|nr:Fe-S cluster assembly protein SufD [Alphaproteobacteria bacterium]